MNARIGSRGRGGIKVIVKDVKDTEIKRKQAWCKDYIIPLKNEQFETLSLVQLSVLSLSDSAGVQDLLAPLAVSS